MSKLCLIAACLAVAPISTALATDFQWNVAGDGFWTVNNNWTPVGQPNAATDNVLIAHPAGAASAVNVTLNTARAVGNLTLNASTGGTNQLTLANNVTLSLNGSFTNNGRVNVTSGGSTTPMSFVNSTTLNGSGAIRLGGNGTLARIIGPAGVTVTNSATHTIEGNGNIGTNLLTLANNGTIRSNVAGATLAIDPSDVGTNINTGTISALNGATAAFAGGTWNNAGGTILADGASSLTTFGEGAVIRNGTLRGINGGVIEVSASVNAFFEDTRFEGSVRAQNNSDFGVSGAIVNAGTISIESAGSATDVEIQAAGATFSGGGTVMLGGASTVAGINGTIGAKLVNAADHTFEGKGRLGQNTIGIDNRGLIRATNATTALEIDPLGSVDVDGAGSNLLNSGTLRAVAGSTLALYGGVYKNTATGVIEADGASALVDLNDGAIIRGGLLRGINGGFVDIHASVDVTFENLSVDGNVRTRNNTDLNLIGTITQTGTLSVESGGSATDIEVQAGGATLTGSGTVVLGGVSTVAGINGVGNPILVHDTAHRIEGKGRLGQNTIGIDNKGTIVANSTTTSLDIDPSNVDIDGNGADFRNTGTLRAEAGSTMRLYGGVYANANLIVADGAGAIVSLEDQAVVRGGTLRGINGGVVQVANAGVDTFLENVTLEGTTTALNNSDLNVSGNFTNNSTLTINSGGSATELDLQASITASGTGTIILGGASSIAGINTTVAASNFTLTNGATHTIRGKGRLGINTIGIVNNGSIIADQPTTALTIDPNASGFTNNGALAAKGAAGLEFESGLHTLAGGSLTIDAGSKAVIASGATLIYQGGSITQAGALTISTGGTLENRITYSPGTAGTFNTVGMAGNFTNTAGATLVADIGGATAGTFDQLTGTGSATLAGTLDLQLRNGFDPALYSPALTLIEDTSGSNISGRFSSVLNVGTGTKRLAVVYVPLTGTTASKVNVVAAVAGDADVNGVVNFADLVSLAQNYNLAGRGWQAGDFNGDGTTNFNDLVSLAQNYNYGTVVEGDTSTFAADWALAQSLVPEPTSLIGLGLAATVLRRRR